MPSKIKRSQIQLVDLVSTTLATDASGNIIASPGGAGDMLKSENLSGLANNATARSNIGLGNVDNTSDSNKPVSTAQATAIGLKANTASPTFTGTVTLPAGQVVNGVTLSTGAGTGNFLRGDGTYSAPSGGGAGDTVVLGNFVNNSTPSWYKIGTLNSFSGARAKLEYIGSSGFNAGDNVVGRSTIILTVLNGAGDPNIEGYFINEGGTPAFTDVRAVRTGASQYYTHELYAFFGSFARGSFQATLTRADISTACSFTFDNTAVGSVPVVGQIIFPPLRGNSNWTAVPQSPARTSNSTFTLTDTGNINLYNLLLQRGTQVKWLESTVEKRAMIVSATYASDTVTVAIVGDTMASIDSSSLKYHNLPAKTIKFQYPLTTAVATDVCAPFQSDKAYRVYGAKAYLATAGVTGSSTYDINKGGTTMFTTKPTLATGVTASADFTANNGTSLASGDIITIDIDAISTTAGVGLTVDLYLGESQLSQQA